jgi:hypothetical protein
VRAFLQAVADLRLVLAEQVVDEFVARVARDLLLGVHETQCRRGDDRLLDRPVGVLERQIQIVVGVRFVAERAAGEPWHAADMAG